MALSSLGLSSAAAFPQVGQSVQVGVAVRDTGGPGGFTLTAALVNPANGKTEGHFYTLPGGAGSLEATGVAIASGVSETVMYAPIHATAADIAGYNPALGLSIQVSLNGALALTVPKAVFMPGVTGGQALVIQSVQAFWNGEFMDAVVTINNPSANVGQAELYGQVLVNGQQRENFGYQTVTVQPNSSIQVPAQTGGTVSPEFDGQTAIAQFQLLVPGTATPIGQAVSGAGLTVGAGGTTSGVSPVLGLVRARR